MDRIAEECGCFLGATSSQVRQVGVIEVLGSERRTGAGFHECLEGHPLNGFVSSCGDVIVQLVKDVWQQLADRDVVACPAHGLNLVRYQLS
jgi:hypothetical protein